MKEDNRMSKRIRHPAAFTLAAVGALMAFVSVVAIAGAGSVAALVPDGAVSGTVLPTGTARVITISMGGTPCTTIIPGSTSAADGTYQIQVNCPSTGTATLVVDGTATSTTFAYYPGTVHSNINATLAGAPNPASTIVPPASTSTPTQATPTATATAAATATPTTVPATAAAAPATATPTTAGSGTVSPATPVAAPSSRRPSSGRAAAPAAARR